MKVVRYHSEHKNTWNAFLEQANNGSFLFHRNFVEYHQDRFLDYSLLLYEHNKLVALLPAHLEDQVLCSHFGLSYGGIIHASTLSFHQYTALLAAIAQHCEEEGIKALLINEIPSIYLHRETNHLSFINYALQGSFPAVQMLSTLDLTVPFELNSNRKRMVKKGKQRGYTIREEATPFAFWADILIPRLHTRYQAQPVHTVEEMAQLMALFPQHIKQMNVYNAAGALVGGTTLFLHPQVVHLQYIAGQEEDNKQGALDFLLYSLIEMYRSQVRYFDFGSSHVSPTLLNPGLLSWKESFGARSIPQYCYTFSIENLLQVSRIIDG